MSNKIWLAVVLASLAVTTAEAEKVSRRDRHQTIDLSYGRIVDFEEVKLKSRAGKGAAVGGLAGLTNASRGHSARDAAAGAALGALLTQAISKHKANSYTVRRTDDQEIKVILDHHTHFRIGDCVSIEEGATTNLRQVSPNLCESEDLHSDMEIRESHLDLADECHRAKEMLLAADDQGFDRALETMKALCY